MRRESSYLPDPHKKRTKEEIEARALSLKKLEEVYCEDGTHEWKYWGGTGKLHKFRFCRVCEKREKFVDNTWIHTRIEL